MGKKRVFPNRGANCRLALDLERFTERLREACGGEAGRNSQDQQWSGDPANLSVAYLFEELLSKFSDGKSSEALYEAAIAKWRVAEEKCAETNRRFLSGMHFTHKFETLGVNASVVLHYARMKIANLLGEFDWNEAERGFGWGPGATYRLPRAQAATYDKNQGILETTPANFALAYACVQRSPLWRSSLEERFLELVPGNKVITVPKTSKIDRVIAVEPRMNLYVQKGIGRMIRNRLRRVGLDLQSQTENRHMALLGSMFDNLATIDLSSASDTISYEVVLELLPVGWADALEQCRSPEGRLKSGEVVTYQKFSSMGNGYTFELETLIFWALVSTCIDILGLTDRRLAVYGDDVIMSSQATPAVSEVFAYFGFTTNTKKSFSEGPFRESCGGHFVAGRDVTPFYVRRPVGTLDQLFLLHNNLYRWCDRNRWNRRWDRAKMGELLTWLRNHAPVQWRSPRIPDGYGDGAFVGTFDQCRPRSAASGFRKTRGIEGFICEVLVWQPRERRDLDGHYLLLDWLHEADRREATSRTEGESDSLAHLRDPITSSLPARGGVFQVRKILVPRFAGLDILI